MGFATLIIAAVGIVYDYFGFGGTRLLYALWGLWWLDVAISLVICFGQLHVMHVSSSHGFWISKVTDEKILNILIYFFLLVWKNVKLWQRESAS